jgi:hypothetical protein
MSAIPQLISRALNIINESHSNALLFARTNPAMAGAAVAGAGGLTILALPAVIVAPIIAVLNLLGFGSGGIVAGRLRRSRFQHWTRSRYLTFSWANMHRLGSVAASTQAGIGNVIAGSTFATLTSAGAGGYIITTIIGAVQAAGGAILGIAGAAAAFVGFMRTNGE